MKRILYYCKGNGEAACIHALYELGKLPNSFLSPTREIKKALEQVSFDPQLAGQWTLIDHKEDEIIYACGTGKSESILHKAWLCFMQLEGACPIEWSLKKVEPYRGR